MSPTPAGRFLIGYDLSDRGYICEYRMPTATLAYSLPEDEPDFDAAINGRKAISALWDIDQRLRSVLKHGEPSDETARLAEEIRGLIPSELLDM